MTSTNDGKEVKSNQTSGQKGKTYYIELYKSLETRLVEPGSGSQRTRAVCEAWRRVHSLCQHSTPSTHSHFRSWIQQHTSQTILQTDWRQSDNKEEQHAWLQEAIDAFIAECNEAISTRNGVIADWENLLLERAQWFRTILTDPWGHPVLKALVNSQGDELTDQEVLEWLKEEKDIMFVTRLRQLAASRSCMDLALRLATAVMDRARVTEGVPGVEQTDKPTRSETTTKSQFVTILENEAGFKTEVWDFVKDIEFVLLYSESRSRCIDLAKQQPHVNAYKLVERLRNRLELSPRDKKVWKNAKEVATLIAQVVIARCMVVPLCTGDTRVALYRCTRSLVRLLPADKLPTAAAALAAPAATARHLHTLALAVHTECKTERKSFVCELYVRAITAGMNELERLKIKTDKESEARSVEKMLSIWFTQLGSLLSTSARMNCECILTAFSVHPTPLMYEQVKIAPPLEPLHKDVQEPKPETNSEFGSWATDSRTQTNLVKTSETLNLKSQKQTNVLSTAMFTEGEALGLEAELCQDLAVLISGPRVKTLSWDMDRELLLENCRTYMERTHGGTRALTTELKYLNLDPRSFQHLPEEDDDENDVYYGIEKGYEHLLETPEEIWENALSDNSEKTDTAHSTEECAIDIPKQKKISKRSQYIEVDPLSTTEETNRTELQERSHTKERSKERRRKKHSMKDEYSQEKTKDIHKKEKKKERKERKKKEKYETIKDSIMHSEGNLSNLVGLKVCRVPDDKCITDSDYDSQRMSSINSECNNPSITEDNFSINDMKRSMYQYNELCSSREVLSKEKTYKVPDKQKSQSLAKNSAHGIFSSYNPVRHVSEEVKKSIKQFVEMKQNNKFTVEPIFRQHETNYNTLNVPKTFPSASVNDNYNYIKGGLQTPNLQPKSNLIMHRERQLSSLKDEVNSVLRHFNDQDNCIKQKFSNVTVETFIPSCLSNEGNKFKVDCTKPVQFGVNSSTTAAAVQHPVQNYKLQTPLNHLLPNTAKSALMKKNESPSQCQFKEFLKQRSVNPTITKPPIRSTFDTPSQMQFQEFLRQQNSFQPTSTLNNTSDIIQKNSQDESIPITATYKKLHTSNNKEKIKTEDSYKQDSSINLQNISHQVSSNITDLGNKNQYQNFLKELMEATNAGAVNDRSEINQPGFDKDSFNQHRKADNALNTFSRLSYLHKNKQNDNKHRLSLDRSSHPQRMSMEELLTLDINYSKNSNRQSKGEVATLNMDKTIPIKENKKIGANSTIINQYPIVSNMLSSGFRYHGPDIVQKDISNVENKNVSVRTSNLSDHDHNDLLLLLHQKSKMNPQSNNDNNTGLNPKTDINVKSKINELSQSSHNLNLDLSKPEISKIDKPVIKTSNSNTSSTTSDLKKVRTLKASSKNIKQQISKENDVSNSDWESVMNALLSHKTPSRGPNALDIVLKKDSFEKRIANKTAENPKSVNSSHARINTVTECGASKTSLTKKDYTHDFKQFQDKKITKVDMNIRVNRKITPKMKDKQFSSFIQNGTDPFISGIPHSDFDLLGELMDDDLRKEIGELLDDDEVYGLGTSTPKTNSIVHNKNKPATSQKPQIIIDTRPNFNSENLTTKLDENLQSKSNGVLKTTIHGKSSAILTSTNISNQPQLICDKLSPEVTVQKSNCKISSDAQANQCAKTITNIAEKNRSLLIANKCNSGNEMKEVKMPHLQTCNFNILESPKVVLAVPQPAPNVVLISNELVYKPLTLEVKQPEPQTQSQFSVNNYVKVNQLSSSFLAINQSSRSYVTVTQPSGGYVANSQPSGSYIAVTQPSASYMAVTQPSATYMAVTQPSGSYVEVHQTPLVTPHYPVVIDTAVTIPVIQRLPQDIPLVNNSSVDILVSEKRTKLKCAKFQLEETNLKTKEINISEESKIKSYSHNAINIKRYSPNESLVRLNPRISEENATVSSKVTEPPVSVPAQVHKPRVSTETIRKYSEPLREFLDSSSVEMNQAVPENSFTNSSKVIETKITAPVKLALTPTVSVHKPRVSTELIQKDSEPSRDILDISSVKVNPKVPENNVTISSKVTEPTVTVALPLVITPLVSVHKLRVSTESIQKGSVSSRDILDSSSVKVNPKLPEKSVTVLTPTACLNKAIISTELMRKDSEPFRDFLDSSSVEVNPKIPEENVTLPSNVIEPTTVAVPLVLTPTASIKKPRDSTELLRKHSEPFLDFLDSSSVEVNPKIPEENVTLPSCTDNVIEPTTVAVPLVLTPTASINKPRVSTELLRKHSEPSRDFLDSSSVEVNPKTPEENVTLPSNVIEPTTVAVPLVLTPTVSINKPRVSTELLRKHSEPSRDFLDSSSVEVNPKISGENVTISSTVTPPVAVSEPKFSVSKLRVPTVTLEDSGPSDNVTLIDRLNQSDCVENKVTSNRIDKSNESNEKINEEDRDFKFDKRFEDEAKITIRDHERIKLKRILLKNRVSHHNYCRNEPIVLTYEPLQIKNEALVSNLKSGELSESETKKDSKNEKNTSTDLLRTNQYKNIIENTSPEMSNKAPNRTNEHKYIENTCPDMSNQEPNKNISMTTLSKLPSRRILLRSSNSIETAIPVTIKPKSLQKTVCKDKIKRKKLKKYQIVLNNDLINNEIEQNTLNKVEDKSGMSNFPKVDLEDQITSSVIKIPSKMNNVKIVDNGRLSKQEKIIPISQVTETTGGYAHNSNILHRNNPNSNSKSNTFKNKTSQKVDSRFNNSKDKIEDKNCRNPNSCKANNSKTADRAKDYKHVTTNNITQSTNSGNLTNSADDSKNKNISEYKDKIIFEELPNVNNDPFKKYVRIKLPGGKTFKATISGKLNINIDSLFEEPSIKAMILKNINNNEKCTLNVKQLVLKKSSLANTTQAKNRSTTSLTNPASFTNSLIAPRTVITQVRDMSTSGINEIIDLISDDEENPTQIFKTEFGNFKSASMNEDVFLKHQRKLSQKCEVKVCRCDFVQETLKLKLTKEIMSINEKPLIPRENITDIIEIDDSSNDSEKNAEKFDLTSFNVKDDVQITELTENVDVLKDMLRNDFGVKDDPEKSNMNKSNVQTQNHLKKCVLKLDKCDELIKKMEIKKNICFVSLVRCDSLVRNTSHFNELANFETQSAKKIQTEDDTKLESYKENHMLRRSESLSILNDFSVIEEVKPDRSSPSLIENLEIPLILSNNNVKTSLNNSSTTYNCNAELFMSKSNLRNLHKETFINANNLDCFAENEKSQIDDKSTDCDSDIENNLLAEDSFVSEEKSYKEKELYQVLSLVKIIINFFANNDSIIEKLKSGQEGSKTVLYSSPLKRKYEEALDKHRQKISKQENCHSYVASKSKKENLCQELLNHKLNVNEEQCFESVSDVIKYDEKDIQALKINNLKRNKLSNIENEQDNKLLDSRKNKIGLDCHIDKNKHVELDEKFFDKTKKVQPIKYTTKSIGKINDINSSYDRTVEIKESVNIIKNDVYDDVHQHFPVTKTKIEKLSNDTLIGFNRKLLKKCVVKIEKCCIEQLSLSEQKSSRSKVDNKPCALRLASDMGTTNTRTIEVSTAPSLIVTGLTELEKNGSSKIDQIIDDTLIIKSKTDVKPSGHEKARGHSDTNMLNGISDHTVKSKLQDNLRNVNQCMLRNTQGYSDKPEDEDLEFYEKIPTKESFEHKTYNSLQKTVAEQEKRDCELDLGPKNDLVEVIIPLNEVENTDIGALENTFAISLPLFSDNDKECKHRTSNINGKHSLQNIRSEKLDAKAVLEGQVNQDVHKTTNQCKNDENTHILEENSKNKIANLNVTSNKHKALNEVKVTLNYNEDTKCNATLGTNRSLLAFPRTESKGSVEKSFEVRNKGTDNTLQENITLVYNGDSLKGSIYENPIVGKCYLFCDNVCNDNSLNVIQALKSKIFEDRHKDERSGNTETKNTNFHVTIPNFTYSRRRVKNENISNNHNSIEDRRKNLKRKIDSCDNKLSKKYRKGKNIDYSKPTFASMSNTSYGKEYKRLFDYWSSIKFSFTRSFHKEYIDVSGKLKSWPITEMHMDVSDLEKKETLLYLDNKLKEKGSFDPMKQTLAEEILSGYIEPQSSCDEINENNFSMGFGERSDRVIQNSGDGDNISKFSAATLSDVKQSQPFLVSEENKKNDRCEFYKSKIEQMEINKRYFSFIHQRDKVRSVFKKTTLDLQSSWLKENFKNKSRALEYCGKNNDLFPYDLLYPDFIEPAPIETTVHVVQVGQLPVSAAAQNPVTCDPRVTQVTNASPSQCSAENSPHEDLQSPIKTEYTELTTADLSLSSLQEHEYHNESQVSVVPTNNENISVKIEISSEDLINASEELSQPQEEETTCKTEPDDLESLVNKNINNIDYSFGPNDNNTLEGQTNPEIKCESPEQNNSGLISQQKQNGSSEKTDQIAHAMNAAGITTSPEPIIPENITTQTLVNMFSQKVCQEVPSSTSQNNFAKASINTMTLQQALAQILPPPLNQTNSQESNQVISNSPVASQVLHIVQGKNTNGSPITVVDNTHNSVISNSGTPVLHIVHNKGVNSTPSTNLHHGNTYSGLSLVDAGLQQGNNQLLHIVNAGTQKNNATGQLLKRVNLLTNVQGSNEQKMLQFVCKSGDGKSIQLNAPHQRSMVLRLQPFESPSIQSNLKTSESQDLSPSSNTNGSVLSKEPNNSQHEIKSRSIYEENYAKFIQNSSNKTISEKSTSLPKFNQAFGKQVFQDGNQKPNETSTNSSHLSSDTENDCQSSENTLNLDHIGHLNSPPLLLRKSPAQTSQTHSNIVHQIKQTIAPMMHGGVIYTRQIPVNIGGGQTINLITVPSTELIDDSNQKQHGDLKFVNQSEIESPIIKIVPQNQSVDMKSEESNNHQTNTSDNVQNNVTQHQPVLTQMRIKLPMLSKTPQMVSGARVVRPSFFQIHRNVIGGANQPVYQQLVLTAAPPLGQHTIRLPHVQTRQVKIATENQSSSESQMSSSTLEQLREFDMVLEQVKERSTVQPNCTNNFSKLNKSSSDTTDCTSVTSTVTESTQQVLYSIGANQSLNVAYVNRKQNTTATPSTAFVRSPDSSGILESSSSAHAHIPHTVTSESTSNDASTQHNQPKAAKVGSKSKSRPKSSSHSSNSLKINPVPPKPSTQKPLEDEQTTQRILYILAEYKEQVENSPDKDKPAPRRRTNPPSHPGSSKRKKSSSSSRRSGARDVSPIHEDTCRTMGSEDSSCGTSQGDCTESCLESHSPQDSPRKVVRKLTFENEISATSQPRTQPQRNVIVADGQTITVARGTSGKPTTAVLMPANYILPVSMVKGGQQIAIVTNRGPKLLTVGGGEGGTNALLLQRLIGPAGLKPVLARPGVRHVRLPTAALHNLQAFNLATTTTVHSQDSAASPSPAPTPPELIETRANSSPWEDRESQDVKPEPESSPEGSGPWLLTADPNDYSYEETVRTENIDRTVLVVQKKYGRQHRLTHVSAAALRHRYAMLENELRLQGSGFLQKSLSEECEDLGVDSPSASELFPEAELLFSSSPAHEAQQQSQTPQPTIHNQSGVPQPDIDDQIASDHLLEHDVHGNQEDLGVTLGLDEGIVTVTEDGMQANIAVDQEEFARSHPNTTFHSEPTEEGEVQPFTITDLKGRQITSTIFHAGRAPATVLVTAPQTTVISQATQINVENNVKYANIDHIINAPSTHRNLNISSVVVKEDGLTKFDNILTDSREIHLSNTASTIVHSTGNATKVIRRVCYEDDKRETRYLMDESDGIIAGDDAKMIAEDSSRDATLESMADVDEGNSSPERHTELFWESNSASERSESRRPLDFSSDSEKCCKSPFEETNSTDSSGVGTHMRLDSVIKEARLVDRAGSGSSDDHPPLRTYPAKRYHNQDGDVERSLSGKTRAGFQEDRLDSHEVPRRASGRGVVKRGCHCCNGSPAPPRPKKAKKKPTMDFNSN